MSISYFTFGTQKKKSLYLFHFENQQHAYINADALYYSISDANCLKCNFLLCDLLNGFYASSYSSTSELFPFSKETPNASNNITFTDVLSILNFTNSNLKNCVLTCETETNVYNFTVKTQKLLTCGH